METQSEKEPFVRWGIALPDKLQATPPTGAKDRTTNTNLQQNIITNSSMTSTTSPSTTVVSSTLTATYTDGVNPKTPTMEEIDTNTTPVVNLTDPPPDVITNITSATSKSISKKLFSLGTLSVTGKSDKDVSVVSGDSLKQVSKPRRRGKKFVYDEGEGDGEDSGDGRRSLALNEDKEERETWGKKVDFLLSVIGFAVDLANVWRFPYLCYKNGGGAFLIPYCVMLVLGGIPLFYMELALGQYNRKGAITCWGRLVPLFKGIGFTVVFIAFYVDFFYNVILAWSLRYLVASFQTVLPWTSCNNSWNTPDCVETSALMGNATVENGSQSAAAEYWRREVLAVHESTGFGDLGILKWDLSLCLLAVYLICYFSIWKGISTSGKVVYFTAVFPYVVLLILLIRGVTLPGALDGIRYYLSPDFSMIMKPQVWVDAATQIFFSLGPGFGVLLAFASYNKFHNNIYKDALVTSCINCCTSFVSGFVIFSVLGYMAHRTGQDIDKVADEGPGLVFVVYPEAIATMPGSSFFAIIFFLMLLTLGLDSSFAGSEAVITALSDEFPIIARNRERFIACLFTFDFLIGLLCCTQGGLFVFRVFEEYAAGFSILFAVLFEAIAVSWIYGIDRLCKDIMEMIGFEPGHYWRLCLKFCAPFIIGLIVINGLIYYQPLCVKDSDHYPWTADLLGWMMACSSMAFIPGVALYGLCTTKGSFSQRLKFLCVPWRDRTPVDESGHELHYGDGAQQLSGVQCSVVLSTSNGVRTEAATQLKLSTGTVQQPNQV